MELAEDGDVAAVVDLVEQRAIAARGLLGTQHQELRAEFHQPTHIARRQLEIGHCRIRRRIRIKHEEGAAAQFFIGTAITELDAGREVLAAQDFDPLNPRSGRQRNRGQKQCCDDDSPHARISSRRGRSANSIDG